MKKKKKRKKKVTQSNKFKISTPTWNEKFELPDVITNTKKYLQSDWLRGVQYFQYLYSVSIFVLPD